MLDGLEQTGQDSRTSKTADYTQMLHRNSTRSHLKNLFFNTKDNEGIRKLVRQLGSSKRACREEKVGETQQKRKLRITDKFYTEISPAGS